ncbi:MAG: cobalamin B12-binding domain-containing protein [candidate division KSB1 bacterium]|nr:cobalamin B12-binding domain-containing protein [candidate division KSB1 bacterium]
MRQKSIVAAAIGDCVHVAGVLSFLRIAEHYGYRTHFLGAAVDVDRLEREIERLRPDMVALSYRLTPETLVPLLARVRAMVEAHHWQDKVWLFGGTPPAAEVARQSGLFTVTFGDATRPQVEAFFARRATEAQPSGPPPQTLMARITAAAPLPLLRHHFGLPSLEATVAGARQLALSGAIDVLSIGPDQNAQACFFRPQEMRPELDGAGGVPLRSPADLRAIYEATRCGNFPLVRCYSGTRDLVRWAEMLAETINVAWGAVPLFWYNVLDGRSNRLLPDAIHENQQAMRWYASRGIPVEVNEAHHWSLREAPDTVAVAAAFLAAYNAKRMGARHYVAQFMFNTPARTSAPMDLAKMQAKVALIESLHDDGFVSVRQTRTGLASMSAAADVAKGQLAASTFYQLALEPHIVHVVAYCEGDHAATPAEIIESAGIVRGVIQNRTLGPLPMTEHPLIRARTEELVDEARLLLEAVRALPAQHVDDPWTDPDTLARAVQMGLLDAPHLCGNPHASGKVATQMKNGACVAVDPKTGEVLKEKERLALLRS